MSSRELCRRDSGSLSGERMISAEILKASVQMSVGLGSAQTPSLN